jgi:type IV secretion system protein VirD4
MEIFADALSYMAGFGLKAYLITQDIRQIVDEYGPYESIVSNCQVRVAFAPNQYETAELLSKMAGIQTIKKASFSFSGSRMSPIPNQVNQSVVEIERPLMTPDEVLRLPPPKKKGTREKERIIGAGDMLIFVSGHRPIYGRQMLYFFDPILNFRAQIPPPQFFYCIRNGAEVPQDPLVGPLPPLILPTPPSSARAGKTNANRPNPQELQPTLGFVERLKSDAE